LAEFPLIVLSRERLSLAITAANLRRQSYDFQQDTLTGRWRWSTVMDVSGSAPRFMVTGIVSPFGILRDSIPIPGEVVEAMSDSITEVKRQFPPAILVGPPSALTFAITEGQGFSVPQEVILTNNGVFGSLLGATLTSSSPSVVVSPAQIGNLSSNETAAFDVAVNSIGLLALDSPYTAVITIQDPSAVNSPQVLPITIDVLPRAEIAASPLGLSFHVVKPLSGAFPTIPSQTFVIQNVGPSGSMLEWQLQKAACVPWLASFGPVHGTLASGESEVVTVVVMPPTTTLTGTYIETLKITGFSTNQSVDVTLQLTVT
jgi:hypothetical protein